MDENMKARIEESFAAQTMMQTLGAEVASVTSGEVQITAPILPLARQQQGFGHAALTFALGDTAAGYAALTMMEPGRDVLTAEIKINLMNPARGALLRATGRVIKPGRRLVVVSAEVHAEDENGAETLVALLQGTMVPV